MCCERNRSLVLGVCLIKTKELPGITRFVFPQAPLKGHARMPRPTSLGSSEELVIQCTQSPRWTRPFLHADFLIDHHTACFKTHVCFFFKFDRWKIWFCSKSWLPADCRVTNISKSEHIWSDQLEPRLWDNGFGMGADSDSIKEMETIALQILGGWCSSQSGLYTT